MTPRLRTLIHLATASPEPDAVLLRRFADTRDPQAFAELVRRYGRLVWGQCRHLLNSETDADDAFQATFLTLAKSIRTLRDSNKLGPWLHGVAYRVCLNSRRLAARRTKREKATAKSEATRPVADSAWDQAFAAVHDELAKLPDTLRVPFVLCVLEGKGTTEAAEQLGLKLGTFSSRLSRAKQQLFDRLSARGLTTGLATLGAVAVGASPAPAAVAIRACDLAAGGAVPANILSLSSGVLTMAMTTAKRWVVAAVLVGGVMGGGVVGAGWMAAQEARAQDSRGHGLPVIRDPLTGQYRTAVAGPDGESSAADPNEVKKQKYEQFLKQLAAQDAQTKLLQERLQAEQKRKEVPPRKPPAEFLYFGQGSGYAPTAAEFERVVKQVEADGYTFVGVVTMKGQTKAKDNEAVPTLVFRRTPAKADTTSNTTLDTFKRYALTPNADEKSLRDENERLRKELADLKAKQPAKRAKAMILLKDIGGDFDAGSNLLSGLVRAKYGADAAAKLEFERCDPHVDVSGGTEEQLKWLAETVKGLTTPKQPAK